MKYTVEKSRLGGSITVTTSKSHSMRAILLASMCGGESRLQKLLPSPDTEAMLAACAAFGAVVERDGDNALIRGTAGALHVPKQVIDVGNSGQVLRFGAAMAATIPYYTIISGDESVRTIRPMNPLLGALTQLGAFAISSKNDGHAPIIIKGPVKAGNVVLDGKDSQPVSALLMLAAFLPGQTRIEVENAGEKPWIDLTLHWLDKLGVGYENQNYSSYTVWGGKSYPGFDYTVPGDWSSAAFPIAAALVSNSAINLENMDINDPQGDKAVLDMFRSMGANIEVDAANKRVRVARHFGLHGAEWDVNAAIDAVPVLAAVACFADSPSIIRGAAIARHKESDRLAAMSSELGKLGACIEEFPDGLKITPVPLHGAKVESRHDHRIAMSLAVAGLACGGVEVQNTDCVAKSFPGFAAAMRTLGANIQEHE